MSGTRGLPETAQFFVALHGIQLLQALERAHMSHLHLTVTLSAEQQDSEANGDESALGEREVNTTFEIK